MHMELELFKNYRGYKLGFLCGKTAIDDVRLDSYCRRCANAQQPLHEFFIDGHRCTTASAIACQIGLQERESWAKPLDSGDAISFARKQLNTLYEGYLKNRVQDNVVEEFQKPAEKPRLKLRIILPTRSIDSTNSSDETVSDDLWQRLTDQCSWKRA